MKQLLFGGLLLCISGASLMKADFISTVISTNPLAYFRLETVNGSSLVNGYTTTYVNGASEGSPGAIPSEPSNNYLKLNNASLQYASTSLSGGINTGVGQFGIAAVP